MGMWSQIIITIFDRRQQLVKDMISIADYCYCVIVYLVATQQAWDLRIYSMEFATNKAFGMKNNFTEGMAQDSSKLPSEPLKIDLVVI